MKVYSDDCACWLPVIRRNILEWFGSGVTTDQSVCCLILCDDFPRFNLLTDVPEGRKYFIKLDSGEVGLAVLFSDKHAVIRFAKENKAKEITEFLSNTYAPFAFSVRI